MTTDSPASHLLARSDNTETAITPLQPAITRWRDFGRNLMMQFLATRTIMLLIGYLATRYLVPSGQNPPGWIECFSRFDGLWYVRIARDGYSFDASRQSSIAFAPLLPMLMRVIGHLLGGTDQAFVLAGVVISNVALLIGLSFVRDTARQVFGERSANRAVWYILICPGSLYLSAVYPMSLMLAIGAASIWFARRQRWGMASTIGMLAPLARPDGVLLLLPLLFEAARCRRGDRQLLWLATIPAACGLWLAAQWLAFGTPFAFIAAQKMWEPSPFITVFHSSRAELILGIAAFFVALTGLGWFTLPVPYSLYSTLFLGLMLWAGRLWSLPRFVVILFPCFITLAWLGTRWKWLHIVYIVTATLLAAIFTLRFSLGLWVA
jgi:hypothetical protein